MTAVDYRMFIFSLMDGAALRYNSSEFDCQSIRVDPELSSLGGYEEHEKSIGGDLLSCTAER